MWDFNAGRAPRMVTRTTVGGNYINYTYTRDGNPLRLRMPDEPGTYELRYSFRDRQVIHTRPITVTD